MSTIVTNPDAIRAVQIVAQRGAVKLEKLGMTRRGPSITSQLKKHYGLKRSASYDDVIAQLNSDLATINAKLGIV